MSDVFFPIKIIIVLIILKYPLFFYKNPQVALFKKKNFEYFCAGVLVKRYYVLTGETRPKASFDRSIC